MRNIAGWIFVEVMNIVREILNVVGVFSEFGVRKFGFAGGDCP